MIGKTNAVAGGVSPIEIIAIDDVDRGWVSGSDSNSSPMYYQKMQIANEAQYTGGGDVLIQLDMHLHMIDVATSVGLTQYDITYGYNKTRATKALNAMGFGALPDGTYRINYIFSKYIRSDIVSSSASSYKWIDGRLGTADVTKSGDTYTYSMIVCSLINKDNTPKGLVIMDIIPL